MGASGSVENLQGVDFSLYETEENSEGFLHLETSHGVQARVIMSILPNEKIIKCARIDMTEKNFAFSHRWEDRSQGTDTYHVHCNDETPFPCQLTAEEVHHLQYYLDSLGQGLWLDYVCIDQSSDADKVAQVSIMGSIYVNATSVTVGPGLAPTLPAADYCSRDWCYQERMFGRVLYVWDFDQIDETKLVAYAKEAALSLGNLESVSRTIAATVAIPSSEDWRLGSLRRVMREHPDTAPYGQQVLDNWTHRSADTVRLLAKLILKIRENANCVAEETTPT